MLVSHNKSFYWESKHWPTMADNTVQWSQISSANCQFLPMWNQSKVQNCAKNHRPRPVISYIFDWLDWTSWACQTRDYLDSNHRKAGVAHMQIAKSKFEPTKTRQLWKQNHQNYLTKTRTQKCSLHTGTKCIQSRIKNLLGPRFRWPYFLRCSAETIWEASTGFSTAISQPHQNDNCSDQTHLKSC